MGGLRLIGFSGPKGSGKDTAAAALTAQDWWIINPGDPIRDMVAVLLRVAGYRCGDADHLVSDPAAREDPLVLLPGHPTPRQLMQRLGDDWGRALIHPDLFAVILRRRIERALTDPNWVNCAGVAVTGIRKPNEAAVIHQLGGQVWAIQRPGFEATGEHTSEQGFDALPCDRVIINSGSIADLHGVVLAELMDAVTEQDTRNPPSQSMAASVPADAAGQGPAAASRRGEAPAVTRSGPAGGCSAEGLAGESDQTPAAKPPHPATPKESFSSAEARGRAPAGADAPHRRPGRGGGQAQ